MAFKMRRVFLIKSKIVYISGIVSVLVMCVNGSDVTTKTDSDTRTGVNVSTEKYIDVNSDERQSRNVRLSAKYSARENINFSKTQTPETADNFVSDTDDYESDSKPEKVDIWDSIYSSIGNVFGACARESEDNRSGPLDSDNGLMKCLKQSAVREFRPVVNGSRISVLNGMIEMDKEDGINFTEDFRVARKDKLDQAVSKDYLLELDRLSRKISVRFKLMPGLFLRVGRRDGGFKMGLVLDETDFSRMEARGRNKKKLKKIKKFLPLLMIPVAIQFLLLPMVLSSLKFMATKALLAGKLALLLVILNGLYGTLVPQHDEYNTRVANDYYGYDGGMEYGAFINRRSERDRALKEDLPYRGH